jgi:hypothetical protein
LGKILTIPTIFPTKKVIKMREKNLFREIVDRALQVIVLVPLSPILTIYFFKDKTVFDRMYKNILVINTKPKPKPVKVDKKNVLVRCMCRHLLIGIREKKVELVGIDEKSYLAGLLLDIKKDLSKEGFFK